MHILIIAITFNLIKKSHFTQIGGKDMNHFIQINLKAILTDEAAACFSLHGFQKNIKVKDFLVIKYLKGILYINFAI